MQEGSQVSETLQPGDMFTLEFDQRDTDENGAERITPAGSVWQVDQVEYQRNRPQYSVSCEATGAWIFLTPSEFRDEGGRPVEKDKADRPAQK